MDLRIYLRPGIRQDVRDQTACVGPKAHSKLRVAQTFDRGFRIQSYIIQPNG